MPRTRPTRPSIAILFAAVALAGAITTTAVAGPGAITNALKKSQVKKIAKKQAKKEIKRQAPDLAVASADTVGLYAHVEPDGTVTDSLSSGIASANVTHPADGAYCFAGMDVTPHTVDGTVDTADGPGVVEASVIPENFIICPPTAQAEVITFDPEPVELRDYAGGFYVRIY